MAQANDHEARRGRIPWPPLVYLGAVAAALLAEHLYPLPWFGPPLSDILFAIGWLLVAGFAFLLVRAVLTLRKARTSVHPTAAASVLVMGGPFAISRNPIYLSDTMILIGIGLIAGVLWFPVFAAIASAVVWKLAIEPEEKHLSQRFGKKYLDYRRKVRRWF